MGGGYGQTGLVLVVLSSSHQRPLPTSSMYCLRVGLISRTPPGSKPAVLNLRCCMCGEEFADK